MKEFAYSSIPVDFEVISMSLSNFLSEKAHPGKFLRSELIFSWSSLKNVAFGWTPFLSSICHFSKMSSNLNHLELEVNIFRNFISLWCLRLVKIWKKSIGQGWHTLDDLTWNYPMKLFFLLTAVAMITVKTSFIHFHSTSCWGDIFLHQNHANY